MRAVVIDGAGSVRVNTQPDPALPGPDGVVVAVTAAGICGSDLHFYEGEYPFTEPVALGHEAVGTIVEAGPQVRTVGVGDLVMVSSVAGCGVCPGCETHDPVMCFSGPMIFGAGVLGGAQADLLAVPAADFQVLKIPEGITTEQALLLTDNLATGWAAAQRADISFGFHCRVRTAATNSAVCNGRDRTGAASQRALTDPLTDRCHPTRHGVGLTAADKIDHLPRTTP